MQQSDKHQFMELEWLHNMEDKYFKQSDKAVF